MHVRQLLITMMLIGAVTLGEVPVTGEIDVAESALPVGNIEIVLHRGRQTVHVDETSAHFGEIVTECERLLTEARDTPLLIMTTERIQRIKSRAAIEIIYRSVQTRSVLGRTVYLTRLLIPLMGGKGEFSDGMVFYAGAPSAGFEGQPEYRRLLEYGATTFAFNVQGTLRLKAALRDASIMLD
jgi:hypothetical protein